MTNLPDSIIRYWDDAFAGEEAVRGGVSLVISDELDLRRPVMMLEVAGRPTRVAVRSDVAERVGIGGDDGAAADGLRHRLARAGVALHDPDYLFYFPAGIRPVPEGDGAARRLTGADRAAFDAFGDAASEQDREDAGVELEHWAVFGCFSGDRLVSAASACLWKKGRIADLGVLTLPDSRGKGLARAAVRAIGGFSRARGYEPQYRCQIDNHASVALARACGLALYGEWTVAMDAS